MAHLQILGYLEATLLAALLETTVLEIPGVPTLEEIIIITIITSPKALQVLEEVTSLRALQILEISPKAHPIPETSPKAPRILETSLKLPPQTTMEVIKQALLHFTTTASTIIIITTTSTTIITTLTTISTTGTLGTKGASEPTVKGRVDSTINSQLPTIITIIITTTTMEVEEVSAVETTVGEEISSFYYKEYFRFDIGFFWGLTFLIVCSLFLPPTFVLIMIVELLTTTTRHPHFVQSCFK